MNEFLAHYTEILSDPAHLAAEITFQVLVEGLLLGLLWPLIKRRLRRDIQVDIAAEHAIIDAEHGITHDIDPLPVPASPPGVYDYAVDGL